MKTTRMLAILVLALGLTTEVANADFTIGTPTNLGPVINSSSGAAGPSISADGLSLFFCSKRPGGSGDADLWVTTRATFFDPWGTPVNLGPIVNSPYEDGMPSISADGLALFFNSKRPGGYGDCDLWVTTRETTEDDWGSPVNLGSTINSSQFEACPSISTDGLMLFFASDRPGGSGRVGLWATTRSTVSDPWGPPVNLGPTVNSLYVDNPPSISDDGLSLFFGSDRPGGFGSLDIWVTTRETTDDDWSAPVNLGPTVNSSAMDYASSISADGSTLFFTSYRSGGYAGYDLWQVKILPVVDLNGDGIVDSADMCIIVDHWGTDEPLCDIGPMPWGDGIVDVQDLIVLAEHLFEEFPPVE